MGTEPNGSQSRRYRKDEGLTQGDYRVTHERHPISVGRDAQHFYPGAGRCPDSAQQRCISQSL